MDMSLSKLQEIVKDRESCHFQSVGLLRVRHNLPTEQQHLKNNVQSLLQILEEKYPEMYL